MPQAKDVRPMPKKVRKAIMGLECAIASGDQVEVDAAIALICDRFLQLTNSLYIFHQRHYLLQKKLKDIRKSLKELEEW